MKKFLCFIIALFVLSCTGLNIRPYDGIIIDKQIKKVPFNMSDLIWFDTYNLKIKPIDKNLKIEDLIVYKSLYDSLFINDTIRVK